MPPKYISRIGTGTGPVPFLMLQGMTLLRRGSRQKAVSDASDAARTIESIISFVGSGDRHGPAPDF